MKTRKARFALFPLCLAVVVAPACAIDDGLDDPQWREAEIGEDPQGTPDCDCPDCSCWAMVGQILGASLYVGEGGFQSSGDDLRVRAFAGDTGVVLTTLPAVRWTCSTSRCRAEFRLDEGTYQLLNSKAMAIELQYADSKTIEDLVIGVDETSKLGVESLDSGESLDLGRVDDLPWLIVEQGE